MENISLKELKILIDVVDDIEIKKVISEIIEEESDEINIEYFLKRIKETGNLNSNDYKLFLLLEEFYLRYRDLKKDD